MTQDEIRAMSDEALTEKVAGVKGIPIIHQDAMPPDRSYISRIQRGIWPRLVMFSATETATGRAWSPPTKIEDAWPLWEEMAQRGGDKVRACLRNNNFFLMVYSEFFGPLSPRAITKAYICWKTQEDSP